MRYGHTAVLLDDVVYLWGGRNDTEGACNVLYAFDIRKSIRIKLHGFTGGPLFNAVVLFRVQGVKDVVFVKQKTRLQRALLG